MEKPEGWLDGYKVVSKMRGGSLLTSAIASFSAVVYSMGATTERPEQCGPLGVFDNEIDAKNFECARLCPERFRAIKCWYLPSGEEWFYNKHHAYTGKVPPGTKFADKVILAEEVYCASNE